MQSTIAHLRSRYFSFGSFTLSCFCQLCVIVVLFALCLECGCGSRVIGGRADERPRIFPWRVSSNHDNAGGAAPSFLRCLLFCFVLPPSLRSLHLLLFLYICLFLPISPPLSHSLSLSSSFLFLMSLAFLIVLDFLSFPSSCVDSVESSPPHTHTHTPHITPSSITNTLLVQYDRRLIIQTDFSLAPSLPP